MRFTFLFDFLLLIIKPKLKTTFNDLIILQFSKDKENQVDKRLSMSHRSRLSNFKEAVDVQSEV